MGKVVRPDFVIPHPGWPQLSYWQRKSEARCFVYVIEANGDFPIKVGQANNVAKRIAGLQTGNPRRLELLHVLVGGVELERDLHDLIGFKDRLVGEWFDGPSIPGFLETVETLASEMVLHHKNGKQLPDYRNFPPFRQRYGQRAPYIDWTEQRRAKRLGEEAA